MQHKINRFLAASLAAVCIVSVVIFSGLAYYLSRENEESITSLGNTYLASMNDRISKHFQTMTELRLAQMENLVKMIPNECRRDAQALRDWLTENARAQGFDSLAYCHLDGSLEMLYGDQLISSSPQTLLQTIETKDQMVTVGIKSGRQKVVLVCLSVSLDLPGMEDCVGLVGELPISYIADTMDLEEREALIYSFVIRKDGSYVVRNAEAVRENYFDRVRAVYEPAKGKSPETYISELEAAMADQTDHSDIVQIHGDLLHLYCSPLPNSVWYLVTLMPYGALNDSVDTMGPRSLYVALAGCAVIMLMLVGIFLGYFRMSRGQVKELEAAKQAAEEASRSKSEFLSNMSHDIRTPMNAIVGMTAIATAHMDDPQQVRNCLKKITLSSRHLLGLINDVLDMSKIESGKMTLNEEMVSLREMVDSIVSIVQPQIKAKNQRFHISIFGITSENVHCDSVRLNQVLLNLLSNAVKFTPNGGSIELMFQEEQSPRGEDYVRIRFQVKDSGIGMSEEFREHIFEPFTREDNKRVHRTEGTGLGMAITKYIVDAMGGEITVSSTQGVGTEFQVVLDLMRAEEQLEDMVLPDWTMLVVDDDQQLCESTVESLRSIGIRAEWVLDGESAVRTVIRHHNSHADYHVILLDWKLPDMDGIRTARELRKQLGEDVPILLMSAYDWTEIEEEAREAGISGFLMKPLFRSTLYYGLKPYAESEQAHSGPEAGKPEFSHKRILVAEDNELNWEIARELLQDLGLELEWAENGKICLDMFRQSQPGYYDAVLMDIRMPEMDGYQATDSIRLLDRPDASVPIIAMTADAYSDDIQRCLEHGMNAHVAKPIDIQEVARILKRYMNA